MRMEKSAIQILPLAYLPALASDLYGATWLKEPVWAC